MTVQDAKYIKVRAGVRYWEDAKLNGVADTEGKVPFRAGDYWLPIIDLESGQVLDWPAGMEARIHYKVCDDGEYWLLDDRRQRIAKWKSDYVPNGVLCVGESGFGDYIIFSITADGRIQGWKPPVLSPEDWLPI